LKWLQIGAIWSRILWLTNVKDFILKQPITYRRFHKPISFLPLVLWSMSFSKPQLSLQLMPTDPLVDGSLVWFFDLLLETWRPNFTFGMLDVYLSLAVPWHGRCFMHALQLH
jgi:hypothetical protein